MNYVIKRQDGKYWSSGKTEWTKDLQKSTPWDRKTDPLGEGETFVKIKLVEER